MQAVDETCRRRYAETSRRCSSSTSSAIAHAMRSASGRRSRASIKSSPNEITIGDLFSIARSATLKSERRVTCDRRIGHRVAARNFR